MRKTLLTLLALALALSAGALGAGAQSAANVLGDVVAVDAAAKQIFVKTDAGAVVIVSVSDATRVLKNPPGETKTDKAVPYTLAEIVAGDRVLALGKLSDDGKTLAGPRVVVVNTKAELTAKQEKERAEWQARGVVGVVSAVNPSTKEITINTRTPEGPKPVVIAAGGEAVKLRRYAPDSIKFADAKPSAFEEVKAGDQLRAKGNKSEDGSKFTAEEVVTGSFRTTLGTVRAVDAAKNEITIEQASDKKPLTVIVRPDSVLKQFPADMAAMMMGGGAAVRTEGSGPPAAGSGSSQGGGGVGARSVVVQGPPGSAPPAGGQSAAGGAPGQGGPRRMMMDPQQMLERLPPVTLAELKPGQMIVVSSTVGADPTRVTAIQLVSNVEPIIAMMSRRPGGPGGGGSMGGGMGAAAGGMNFGFGIGTP
jgi:hypothetical protein